MLNELKSSFVKSLPEKLGEAYEEAFTRTTESIINNDSKLREQAHKAEMAAYDKQIEEYESDHKKRSELELKKYAAEKKYQQELADEEKSLMEQRVNKFKDVLSDSSKNLTQKISAIQELKAEDPEAFKEAMKEATSSLASFAKSLESTVSTIGAYKTA